MGVTMASSKAPNPIKMITDAFDLFDVAVATSVKKFEEKELIPASTTSSFILGSSIELALMGYLTHKGFDKDELVNINHDLEIALEKANKAGLNTITTLSEEYIGSVLELNSEFKHQNIEITDLNQSKTKVLVNLKNGTHHLLTTIADEIGLNNIVAI